MPEITSTKYGYAVVHVSRKVSKSSKLLDHEIGLDPYLVYVKAAFSQWQTEPSAVTAFGPSLRGEDGPVNSIFEVQTNG